MHILDLAENGLAAAADLIEIDLEKDTARDRLRIVITDNGTGIPPEDIPNVTNPFFTTRTTRRVGLGLPMYRQAAEQCDGMFRIASSPSGGTRVEADFRLSHLDRAPLGDMAGTLLALIVGRPDVDIVYRQKTESGEFVLDTRELKAALDGLSASDPDVLRFLRDYIGQGLAELGSI